MKILNVNNFSDNTSFSAKVKIKPNKKIIDKSDFEYLEDIARSIGTKKDAIVFDVGKIKKSEGKEITHDGVDIFNVFSRDIKASFNINGKSSKIQNLSKGDNYKTYSEGLPIKNILNRPFEYMCEYVENLSKKYEDLFNKPVV